MIDRDRLKFVVPRARTAYVEVVIHRHWERGAKFKVVRRWHFWREITVKGPPEVLDAIRQDLEKMGVTRFR